MAEVPFLAYQLHAVPWRAPVGELAAKLDTVIIDVAPTPNSPGKKPSVVCVWRATVACSPDVRVLEARVLSRAEADALREAAQDPASPPSASLPNQSLPTNA